MDKEICCNFFLKKINCEMMNTVSAYTIDNTCTTRTTMNFNGTSIPPPISTKKRSSSLFLHP
jgi:hypothetical protein